MTAITRPSPLTIVVTLFFVGTAGVAVCAAYSRPAPSAFMVLYWAGLGWAFAWWVLADCRARGTGSSIDHGWYVFYLWPLAVPYHVLKTRGIRGCGTLLALLSAYVIAYLFSLGIFFLLTP